MKTNIVLVAACLGSLAHTLPAQVDWRTEWIVQYRGASLAYDSGRDRLVAFGGRLPSGQYASETWEWDGADWTQVFPETSPSARTAAAMIYDSARAVTVLFGGIDATGGVTDMWEWDGSTWTQVLPVHRPGISIVAMTDDTQRSRVVAVADGVWEWDGTDWTQYVPWFSYSLVSSIAYDAARENCVIVNTGPFPTGGLETWLWDGVSLVSAGTSPQVGPLVDDPLHGYVLLCSNDTWAWTGGFWSLVSTTSSPGIPVYDGGRGRPVGIGGGWTSEWDGGAWVRVVPFLSPTEIAGPNLAYDSQRDRTVFAGAGTWEWDGRRWEEKAPAVEPPARWFTATAYAASLGRVVLFGGGTSSGAVGDTWLWDGTSWTDASLSVSPPPRYFHALVWDSQRERAVVFGGLQAIGMRLGDTWEFDGATWVQRVPATSPSVRYRHGLSYDEMRKKTVLFGGLSAAGKLHDTWEWDGMNWQQRFPVTSPSARDGHTMAYDSSRGRVVLFGGSTAAGPVNETWEWDGTSWTQRATTNMPTPRTLVGLAYDTLRRELVAYGGAGLQDTWQYASTDPATFATSQTGCPGSAGTPTLTITTPSGYPWLGEPFTVAVTNLAPGHPAAMAAGFSNTQWAGIPLPLSLTFIGMFGCQALCSAELFFPMPPADPSGTTTWTLGPIPNDPGFLGFRFFTQAWVADAVNPAGLIVSNLGEAVVGGK
jgi:hypothetical protein